MKQYFIKIKIAYLFAKIRAKQIYEITCAKIGDFLYWLLCHLADNWKIYLALIVGLILGG